MSQAQATAEALIAAGCPRTINRFPRTDELVEELLAVNAAESKDLAAAFLAPRFLQAQVDFAVAKNKPKQARVFKGLLATRPLWSLLL